MGAGGLRRRSAEDPRRASRRPDKSGAFYVEFRVRHPDGSSIGWPAKGQVVAKDDLTGQLLRGAYYDITERKALEARLLALNETLEARVHELREEARTLEMLNRTGMAIAGELDLKVWSRPLPTPASSSAARSSAHSFTT